MSSDRAPAVEVEGLSKVYPLGRVSSLETSLREQFTALARAPWRLFAPLRRQPGRTIRALEPISFTVPRGEKLGIIGRNGSGKSTLLKLLSRITMPTAGSALIRGRPASILEVGTGFHPELTGHENIFLNGAVFGLTSGFIKRHFDRIVAFSGVGEFLDLPVKRYSSGMYVRLAFAVAAHIEADVLLIDEVLAVGDQEFRQRCVERMQAEVGKGRTVMLVSHDMDTIATFCDRVIHMVDGRIDFDGEPAVAIDRYRRLCATPPMDE